MAELVELIKEGIVWFIPIESFKTNPYIPIYIFLICVAIGFLIINYKYIIEDFNQVYEDLGYLSKVFLAIAVGFIITLTGTVMLLSVNTISSVLLQESIINSYAGITILILSFIVGFTYFISMRKEDDKNPFLIIKKLYSVMLKLMVKILILVGIIIMVRAVYLSQTGSIFMRILKVLAEVYLVYFLLKTVQSISDDYYKDYKKRFFFSEEVNSAISKIEKTYSFVEKLIFSLFKKAKKLV